MEVESHDWDKVATRCLELLRDKNRPYQKADVALLGPRPVAKAKPQAKPKAKPKTKPETKPMTKPKTTALAQPWAEIFRK